MSDRIAYDPNLFLKLENPTVQQLEAQAEYLRKFASQQNDDIKAIEVEKNVVKTRNQTLVAFKAAGGLKPPKPSKFDGKERQYAVPWFESFEHYCAASGLVEHVYKIQLFVTYLEKDASLWYSS